LESLKSTSAEVIVVCADCTPDNVKVIETLVSTLPDGKVIKATNLNRAGACNAGAKEAQGEYILFLADDIVLPSGIVEQLEMAIEDVGLQLRAPVGAIGPLCNNVPGQQRLDLRGATADNVQSVQDKLHSKGFPRFWEVGYLTSFCMFVKKSAFDAVNGFVEELYEGVEDVDFILRLYLAGFHSYVCSDGYVFRRGVALPPQWDMIGGSSRIPFLKRWRQKVKEEPLVLGVMYRVRIEDQDELKLFDKSIKKMSQIGDWIFILDDDSPLDITLVLRRYDNIIYYKDKERKDELDQRQDLVDLATIQHSCNWLWSIDADEIPEDKVDRMYIEQMLRKLSPETLCLRLQYYTMWNDENNYRTDKHFGFADMPRICKVYKGCKIDWWKDRGHKNTKIHVGNVPYYPIEYHAQSSIRIKHFGYLTEEMRRKKFDFYTKLDPNPDPMLAGDKDYKFLIDTDVKISHFSEDAQCTVGSVMKNEVGILDEYLKIASAFFDEVILLDTGSTDGSIELAQLYNVRILTGSIDDGFDVCRNKILKEVSTPWFQHLDIDERIHDLRILNRQLDNPHVDCFCFSVHNWIPQASKPSFSETIRLMRNPQKMEYTGHVHETVDYCAHKLNLDVHRSRTVVDHFGYLKPKVDVGKKLDHYWSMYQKMAEKSPKDPRPWFSMAVHLIEQNSLDPEAEKLLKKALGLESQFYAPAKELGFYYLRLSRQYFEVTIDMLPEGHPLRTSLKMLIDQLSRLMEA